jgi:hypothetical protein
MAIGFSEKRVLHYERNLDWFRQSGTNVEIVPDKQFDDWCKNFRMEIEKQGSAAITIGIDISCFNRYRLACLVNTIRTVRSAGHLKTIFWYSLATFSPPSGISAPNSHVGPVHSSFAGWFARPELPPVAIVGLGYEQDKALGAVEHIEAASSWAFIPRSPEVEYLKHVKTANATLLETIPVERQIFYNAAFPANCMATLQSLTSGLVEDYNAVLLPFGPKIFALCCLLVAVSDDRLPVWRVSSLENEEPMDRAPSPHVFGLEVDWGNSDKREEANHDLELAATW